VSDCSAVRQISNGIINTIVPKGAVYDPFGLAVDAFGNLYIADDGQSVVKELSGGVLTTIAGNGTNGLPAGDGGPAVAATLDVPLWVSVDSAENVYITDLLRVRRVTQGVINTIAGNGQQGSSGDGGPAVLASFGQPT
jgi:hypothetical protein